MAHSRTADMAAVVREADIVVGAAGQARMITADMVKPGAAVIDVGVSRTEAGIVGDVDYGPVSEVAGWITPMPGGTGPMTIACLMENTVSAAAAAGRDERSLTSARASSAPDDVDVGEWPTEPRSACR